jgi:hypothetical protein
MLSRKTARWLSVDDVYWNWWVFIAGTLSSGFLKDKAGLGPPCRHESRVFGREPHRDSARACTGKMSVLGFRNIPLCSRRLLMDPAALIPSPDAIPVAWGWFELFLLSHSPATCCS